jgi:AcrR family transcriptional regulator
MTSANPDRAPSRRERRRRELHERILEAAVALFQRKGFDGTTALEIANSADVAEKTFYNHFPTKQHLIQELAGRSLDAAVELLAEARRMPGTTADQLRHFAERSAERAEQGSRELTAKCCSSSCASPRWKAADPIASARSTTAFRALLDDGIARGDVAPGGDLEFVTDLAVATYLGIIINWVTQPDYRCASGCVSRAESGAGMLASWPTPRCTKGRR